MRKLLTVAILIYSVSFANAENIIESTLLDHVVTVTQFRSGKTNLALLDSIVRIGSINESSILDIQAGFSGATKPEPGQSAAANLVAGAFLKVNPFLDSYVSFPEHWKFLSSLEHGAYINYDAREKAWYGGYQAGLAFGLNPK